MKRKKFETLKKADIIADIQHGARLLQAVAVIERETDREYRAAGFTDQIIALIKASAENAVSLADDPGTRRAK